MTKLVLSTLLVLVCLSLLLFIFTFMPVTYDDWVRFLRPAARRWRRPYVRGAYNPPWLFLFLHPLAVLPERVGAGVLMVLSLGIVAAYTRTPWKTLLVGVSAPMVSLFTLGQVDTLMLAGLMAPGWVGMPLLMTKPQGVFLSALCRIDARAVVSVALVLMLSVLVWGRWWEHALDGTRVVGSKHDVSPFPFGIPAGILALWFGLRQRSDALLCLASLCFTPYFQMSSTLPAVAASVRETRSRVGALAIVFLSWAYWLLRL
jgi:hypothetical protein